MFGRRLSDGAYVEKAAMADAVDRLPAANVHRSPSFSLHHTQQQLAKRTKPLASKYAHARAAFEGVGRRLGSASSSPKNGIGIGTKEQKHSNAALRNGNVRHVNTYSL